MSEQQQQPKGFLATIGPVVAISAGLMGIMGSCTAMGTTGAVAIRLFTQTEVKVDNIEARLGKVESMATTTAEHFNGPARNAHTELVGRVERIDAELKTKASGEAMKALQERIDQQFAHVIGLLNEVRDVKRERKD